MNSHDYHQVLFKSLCRKCDIREDTIRLLSHPDVQCNSIPALKFLDDKEKQFVLNKLTVGQRSCLRLAFVEIQQFEKVPANNQLIRIDSKCEIGMVTEYDNEEEFQSWCQSYRLDEDTKKLLRFHSCDSIPALKYLSLMEMELLLFWNISKIGQRSALKAAIAELCDVNEWGKFPELHNGGQNTDIEGLRKEIHWQLPVLLGREIGSDGHFQEIITLARGILYPADITRSLKTMEDLWKTLDLRGIIEVGKYDKFKRILRNAKLPKLVNILDEGVASIQATYKEEVCKTLLGTARRRSSFGRNRTNDPSASDVPGRGMVSAVTSFVNEDVFYNVSPVVEESYRCGYVERRNHTVVRQDQLSEGDPPKPSALVASGGGIKETFALADPVGNTVVPSHEQADHEITTVPSHEQADHEITTVPSHEQADHEITTLPSHEQADHEITTVPSHKQADHDITTVPSHEQADHEITTVPLCEQADHEITTVPSHEQADHEITTVPLCEQADHEITAVPSHEQADHEITTVPLCEQADHDITTVPSHEQADHEITTVPLCEEGDPECSKTGPLCEPAGHEENITLPSGEQVYHETINVPSLRQPDRLEGTFISSGEQDDHGESTSVTLREPVDHVEATTTPSRDPVVHEASITVPSREQAHHESKLVRSDNLRKAFISSSEQDDHEESVAVTSREPADHVEGRTGPSNGKADHNESITVPLCEQSDQEDSAAEPPYVQADSATNTVDEEELCCLFSSMTIK